MREVVDKIDGGWRIPLEGFVAVSAEGIGNTHLRLEREGVEAFIIVPVDMVAAIEALAVARAVVAGATVTPDSMLSVEFGEGLVLSIPPDPDYENWEVQDPGDILVVGMPSGGEPAIWDAKSKTYVIRGGEVPRELEEELEAQFRETKGDDE